MSDPATARANHLAQEVAFILEDQMVRNDIGPRLTCDEATTVAAFLDYWRGGESGRLFIQAHAWGDDEPDDEHHALYCTLHVIV